MQLVPTDRMASMVSSMSSSPLRPLSLEVSLDTQLFFLGQHGQSHRPTCQQDNCKDKTRWTFNIDKQIQKQANLITDLRTLRDGDSPFWSTTYQFIFFSLSIKYNVPGQSLGRSWRCCSILSSPLIQSFYILVWLQSLWLANWLGEEWGQLMLLCCPS